MLEITPEKSRKEQKVTECEEPALVSEQPKLTIPDRN